MPDPVRYWCDAGWSTWNRSRSNVLFPSIRDSAGKLTPCERAVLRPALFHDSDGDLDAQRRHRVAEIINGSKTHNHAQLCAHIARHLDVVECRDQLKLLPHFSVLADAGVDAMDAMWTCLSDKPYEPVRRVAAEVADRLDQLHRASTTWLKLKRPHLAGERTVSGLAHGIITARSDGDRTVALVKHHMQYGGGLRWFSLDEDDARLIRIAPERPTQTAPYRFRLYALSRLAAQCGIVATVPPFLDYSLGEEE